jgi:hypothetical protein
MVHGLQNVKYTEFNDKLVRVSSQREDGRYQTKSYEGCTAGAKFIFDDGEVELLAFDPEKQLWACKQPLQQQADGTVLYRYVWVPEKDCR